MKKYLVCISIFFMAILHAQVLPGYLAPKGLTITQVGKRALDQEGILGNGYLATDASGRCYGLAQTGKLYLYDTKTKQIGKIKGLYNSFVSDNLGNVYALEYDPANGMGKFLLLNGLADPMEKFKVKLFKHISALEMGGLDLRNVFIAGDYVYELECSLTDQVLYLQKTNVKTGESIRAELESDNYSMMLAYSYSVVADVLYVLVWTVDGDGAYQKDVIALDYQKMKLLSRKPFLIEEMSYPDQVLVGKKYLSVVDYNHIIYYDIKKDKMFESPMNVELGNRVVVDAAMTEAGIFYYVIENGYEVLYLYDFSTKNCEKIFAPKLGKDSLGWVGSICSSGNTAYINTDDGISQIVDGEYVSDVEIKKSETSSDDFSFTSPMAVNSFGAFFIAGRSLHAFLLENGFLKGINFQKELDEDAFICSIASDSKEAFFIRQIKYGADNIWRYVLGSNEVEVLFNRPYTRVFHHSILVLPNGNLVLNDDESIEICGINGVILKTSEDIPGAKLSDFIADMEYYAAKNLIVCLQVNSITLFDAETLKIKKTIKLSDDANMIDFTVTENGEIYIVDDSDYCIRVKGVFDGM